MASSDYEVLAPFALVTVRLASEPAERLGLLTRDGSLRVFDDAPYLGLFSALQHWDSLESRLRRDGDTGRQVEEPFTLLAPLRYPQKVICVAANHIDHLREIGADMTQVTPAWTPFFFLKPPTTTVIGPGDPVAIPHHVADPRLDWEGEVGMVIGRPVKDATPEEAMRAVAGFTVVNDLSARGAMRREVAPAEAVRFDWLSTKGFDGSFPMGPGLVPHWLVPDPGALRITSTVDGQTMQDSTTEFLVADMYYLASTISRFITLEPGDIIATGTPGGVGNARGVFLSPGSTVSVQVDGIGRLTNPIVAR